MASLVYMNRIEVKNSIFCNILALQAEYTVIRTPYVNQGGKYKCNICRQGQLRAEHEI